MDTNLETHSLRDCGICPVVSMVSGGKGWIDLCSCEFPSPCYVLCMNRGVSYVVGTSCRNVSDWPHRTIHKVTILIKGKSEFPEKLSS